MTQRPRIGIVGASRTRNGLGPFLASAFVGAGAQVVGVVGSSAASGQRAADLLAKQLGGTVAVHDSAEALAETVDALVIAAPPEVHLSALRAALAASVPCLCEKPLVLPSDTDAAIAVVADFRERELLLMENCQWPFVLPTMLQLLPDLVGARIVTVDMGLSPQPAGAAMVLDSLSHVLSVAQALVPIDAAASVRSVRQSNGAPAAEQNLLQFDLLSAGRPIAVALHLERHQNQPRPAWIAVNGRRVDRRIGSGYAQFLVNTDGREQTLPDPLHSLVYRFASLLTRAARDDARTYADSIITRLRCFRSILDALAGES